MGRRTQVIAGWLNRMQDSARMGLAVAVVAGFGVDSLQAANLPVPQAATATAHGQAASSSAPLSPLPIAIAADSTSGQTPGGKTQPPTSPVTKPGTASSSALLPMPDEVDPAVGTSSEKHAPQVTYRDGLLTIDARNSTLAEVLRLIAEKTGAAIDVPPGSGLDRIVEHAGPGRADDVLVRLLNGSAFDFVIMTSPQRPHEPTRVLLSLHGAEIKAVPPSSPPSETATSSPLWTPPAETPTAMVLPALDDGSLAPPKDPMTPEMLSKKMLDRARQLREQIQQQQPPPQ